MFKGKNILVAGEAGFVGTNLTNRLLSLGANVRATLHRKTRIILDNRVEYAKCDLLIMDDCKKVVSDIDYVFMCADEMFQTLRNKKDDWILYKSTKKEPKN